ncbi:tRNA glutamyl-Q(34) synthetase GluQRS [Trueperella pyogenes]|uniref:tRNA glutamyl-Q(34) synthetase GluQRS n=1 Tax=Trueperella pyogenes TaxID=1661 RepID=UPI00057F4947|nr:tRNA glutamyl-Q(34) synthetase GluQRS [Trueperella pyogenes]AJC70187.1 glutamyl-Q tRNA(Asp) ligase [Trueperella pyogenes TP8]AZR02778.1 tRNA glutamyl-Q(34) synthetase GluQRS [Trueperella pyogenes]MBB3025689.1 glutamyl-tRNA synthetase [Trueperella pyogenes]UVJ55949.1 tRNA glutamyl-Q(34) synthetase GluQRS [Trueperella pyogenes]WHU58687.1 tRNA glutamyl-Q(34) synthetase GluQRS [Trueperella pyogenes]
MTGRYAPSPTGDLHLGNLRTALLAWAFARHDSKRFHMRMENLDDRSRPEYYERQLSDLAAIGIDWDGDVLYQTDRIDRYDHIFAELAERGLLYECYCTRRELADVASAPHRPPGSYPGTCRNLTAAQREAGRAKLAGMNRGPAYRLRTDVADMTVTDRIAGEYTGAVDDLVIRRGDGAYSYNFVSVVDDGEYGITQVVRGDDLLPSTPRQVYLQKLLGYATPEYIHVPLVLNREGVRLAKRDGAVTLSELSGFGWTPDDVRALLLSSLGLAPGAGVAEFVPESIPKQPWILDVAGLAAGPHA